MKQILGNNLTDILRILHIPAELKYKGERFEVWQLYDKDFEVLCGISDEEWGRADRNGNGWFRYGKCIFEGESLYTYTVCGRTMLGYCKYGLSPYEMNSDAYFSRNYSSFTDWLMEVFQLSSEKNIAVFAISLAEENGLSLADFMRQFQS